MVRVLKHVKVHVEVAHVKVVTLVEKYNIKFYFYVWILVTKVFTLIMLLENINKSSFSNKM